MIETTVLTHFPKLVIRCFLDILYKYKYDAYVLINVFYHNHVKVYATENRRIMLDKDL